MSSGSARLAALASCGAALFVLVLYAPALQAPFLVPKFAALELMAALGFLAFSVQRAAGPRRPWTRWTALGGFLVLATSLLAWVAASARPFGAPYAADDLARWGAFFGLACGTSALNDSQEARQRVLEAITVAAAAVAVVGLLQHFELLTTSIPVISLPGSTFGNRNIAAEAMAMALPLGLGALAGARSGARRAMLGALALELLFLAVTRARGAWFGATLGLAVAFLMARRPWPRRSIVTGSIAVAAFALAAIVPGRVNARDAGDSKRASDFVQILRDSVDANSIAVKTRLGLWRRTLVMIRERPLLGVGAGNWPIVFPRYAEPNAAEDGVLTPTLAPRQAHEDLLQRASETGIVGATALGILIAGVALAVHRRLRAEDEAARATTAAAAGALVALVALGLTGFPFEMPGTLALGGLALGFVAVDARAGPVHAPGRFAGYAGIAVALLFFAYATTRAERSVRGSAWLGAAERSIHNGGEPASILRDLQRASDAMPQDFRTRLRTAQTLLRDHRPAESAGAARDALAIEPYSPNAWAALAAAELEAKDYSGARRDATRALTLLRDYPLALELRLNAAEREGDAVAAQEDRQRLTALAADSPDLETSRAASRIIDENK